MLRDDDDHGQHGPGSAANCIELKLVVGASVKYVNSELCNNVTRHATYKRYADYCGVEHNHDIDADQDDHDYSTISAAISDDSCKIKPPIMIPVEKFEASV